MATTYTVYPVGADLGQTPKYPGKYKNVNGLSLCCESCFDIESPEDFESEIESLPSEREGNSL